MNDSHEWDRLLQNAKTGDRDAQNRLCERLKVRLSSVVKYRLQGWSSEEREDILQDTLLVFMEKMPQVNSQPQHYALAILKNKIGNALQHRRIATHLPLRDSNGSDTEQQKCLAAEILSTGETESEFLDKLDKKLALEHILGALTELSDFCRVFFIGMIEGQSLRDVWQLSKACEPNLRRSAFDKRTFDCRRRLRELLARQGGRE